MAPEGKTQTPGVGLHLLREGQQIESLSVPEIQGPHSQEEMG